MIPGADYFLIHVSVKKTSYSSALLSTGQQGVRLRVVPHFSSGIMSRASETRARVKITPREPRVAFSRVG